MTIHQKLTAGFVVLACLNLGLHPDYFSSAVAVIAAVALYGFAILIERKEMLASAEIQKKIKELDDKVQTLAIQRGLGR